MITRRLLFDSIAVLLLPVINRLVLAKADARPGGDSNYNVAISSSGGGSCPQGTSYSDGCPNAPAGTAQYPNLFTSAAGGPPSTEVTTNNTHAPYAVRPPWNVAGVDYKVGVPAGTVLISPSQVLNNGATLNTNSATASGSVLNFASTAGVMVGMTISGTNIPGNTTVQSVTSTTITMSAVVTGTVANGAAIAFGGVSNGGGTLVPLVNNIVFDSIALGNWAIVQPNDRSVFNTTVIRCTGTTSAFSFDSGSINFEGPSNGVPGCSGLTVRYCEIDNFTSGQNTTQALLWSGGSTSGGGNVTIEYCWIKNSSQNLLSMGAYGPQLCNYTLRFNVLENFGATTNGAIHCEIAQTYASLYWSVGFASSSAAISWLGNFFGVGGNFVNIGGAAPFPLTAGSIGTAVAFYSDGSLPGQVTQFSTLYYVVAVDTVAKTFQVSATPGGTAITFSSAGTGNCGVSWYTMVNYNWQFNTIINNLSYPQSFAGTAGATFQGNSHSGSYGLHFCTPSAIFSYNTCINAEGTAAGINVQAMINLCQLQQAGTLIQNNYLDPNPTAPSNLQTPLTLKEGSDLTSPTPPNGYLGYNWNAAFTENGNINLNTGGSINN